MKTHAIMAIYTDTEMKAAAEKLAKSQRRSLSAYVCLLLEREIEKYEQMMAQYDAEKGIAK